MGHCQLALSQDMKIFLHESIVDNIECEKVPLVNGFL